jgi:uncharacterized protein (DUF302 family)
VTTTRPGPPGPRPPRAISPDPQTGGVAGAAGVVTKSSPRSAPDTVARLLELLHSKGLKVFAVIDQQEEARAVGLELRATTLVVFGNPAAGTGVMVASPLAALDLPLKVLVWADPDRGTVVSYVAPSALAERYGLSPESEAALEGVNGLTDALVAT